MNSLKGRKSHSPLGTVKKRLFLNEDYWDLNTLISFYIKVGSLCMRISAYPLSLARAQAACVEDGATLAYIPDQDTQDDLKKLIEMKRTR